MTETKPKGILGRLLATPAALARGFERGIGALFRALSWPMALFVLFGVPTIAFVAVSALVTSVRFSHMTPAEHLEQAIDACGTGPHCADTDTAAHHLSEIHASAPPEIRSKASALWVSVFQQLAEKRRAEEQGGNESQEQRQVERQEKRDEDAQASSYWPTTIRVDTDMDSFWLPDEERTCQTFPDVKGRVGTVTCDSTAHTSHNIPVRFWGGVDRNAVSDWKCRRESDRFVCRAIN